MAVDSPSTPQTYSANEPITYEGMRKMLGGNGSGTPDGLFAMGVGLCIAAKKGGEIAADEFLLNDIETIMDLDASKTAKGIALSSFTPWGKLKKVAEGIEEGKDLLEHVIEAQKKAEKAKDTAKDANKSVENVGIETKATGASVADDISKQGKKVVDKFNIDDAYVKPKHLSTTKGNGAKFLGDSKGAAEQILKDSMKNGTVQSITDNGLTKLGKQSYSVIIDSRKTIGTKGENLIKVVLSEDGGMLSAYPIK